MGASSFPVMCRARQGCLSCLAPGSDEAVGGTVSRSTLPARSPMSSLQFGAVSGAVTLAATTQELQRKLASGQLTQAQAEAAMAQHAQQARDQ